MAMRVTVAAALLVLSGCGGEGESSGAALVGSGWDGTKACDRIAQADVAAVTGQAAKPGELEGVVPASGGGAAVSMCSFALADGRVVNLLTRVSSGQDLAGSVNSIKNPPADYAMGTLVDVPGIGRAALWNEQMHQLHWWRDGDHYAILTFANGDYTKKPDLSTSRAQAIALAGRVR